MALEAKLLQKLSQNLLMTPQLQQAIKLLQLGRMEYLEAIEKELLENPLLEEVREESDPAASAVTDSSTSSDMNGGAYADEPGAASTDGALDSKRGEPSVVSGEEPGIDWENYLDSFTDSRGAATPKGLFDNEERPGVEATVGNSETLTEHLVAQIRMAGLDSSEERIALHLVGNLDKHGYLVEPLEEIAESCGCSAEQIQGVLEFLQSLDPVGVGARDLKECLIIQLEHLGLREGLASAIISKHLDKLEKRRYDQIAKAEDVALEDVARAVSVIRSLEPRPGRAFADDSTRYVVPDVYVYKVSGEYVISLNDDGLPKLRVSPYYLKVLRSEEQGDVPNKAYLNERLKAASWLIRSIHQRQQTIYRVTESIVKFQRDFLEHGISRLRPLVLKNVADDIGMHESTVSRITTEKYVHTPQGVFELKFFFTTGIKGSDGDVSSSSVKERIKALITAESPDNPLSDQQLVEALKGENITIARRTVAKYRESLGIESSSRRKRPF
jgi:RNA polymerase sigma-54 factor